MTPSASDASRALDRDVAGAASAHQRLLSTLDRSLGVRVGGLDPRAPSRLPGWTLGHVLTHLARNADGHTWMLEEAAQGRVGDQYPPAGHADSFARREADIERGATRSAEALVADVRRTIWTLESAWAATDWTGSGRMVTGAEVPLSGLPFLRWRETEIHHVDLGLGVEFADLPAEYVRLELRQAEMRWTARRPMGLTALPEAALRLPPADRLAWLWGRLEVDGLPPADVS